LIPSVWYQSTGLGSLPHGRAQDPERSRPAVERRVGEHLKSVRKETLQRNPLFLEKEAAIRSELKFVEWMLEQTSV